MVGLGFLFREEDEQSTVYKIRDFSKHLSRLSTFFRDLIFRLRDLYLPFLDLNTVPRIISSL